MGCGSSGNRAAPGASKPSRRKTPGRQEEETSDSLEASSAETAGLRAAADCGSQCDDTDRLAIKPPTTCPPQVETVDISNIDSMVDRDLPEILPHTVPGTAPPPPPLPQARLRGVEPCPAAKSSACPLRSASPRIAKAHAAFAALGALDMGVLANVDAAFAALPADTDDMDDPDDMDSPVKGSMHDETNNAHCKFPQVDVAFQTRKLLLTWVRWGRNSLRITKEEKLKAMQHVKHPRYYDRHYEAAPTPPLSPQVTPRGDHGPLERTNRSRDGVLGSRRDIATSGSFFLDELRQEQRDSMDAEGVKTQLKRRLGNDAAVAKSTGTPGFGVDTPNFPFSKSRTSKDNSVAASAVSSGVPTPLAGGQLSPWILEAEALIEEREDEDDDPLSCYEDSALTSTRATSTVAWDGCAPHALDSPTVMLQKLMEPLDMESNPSAESHLPENLADELDQVCLFSSLAENVKAENTASEHGTTSKLQRTDCNKSVADKVGHSEDVSEELMPAIDGPRKYANPAYQPGDMVSYWSDTKNTWLPARIVERKSRNVYLVDKQLKGCYSKVRSSDLISDAEGRESPILRALAALEFLDKPCGKQSGRKASAKTRLSTPSHPATCAMPKDLGRKPSPRTVLPAISPRPTTPGGSQGRVVRNDFSDDESDGD